MKLFKPVTCQHFAGLIALSVVGFAATASAATLNIGPFAVEQSKSLQMTFHRKPFIFGDSLYPLPDWNQAGAPRVDKQGHLQVLNVIQKVGRQLSYRKEIGLRPDGVVELTIKIDSGPFGDKSSGYKLLIPLDFLDNATFRAVAGRASRTKEYSGKITRDMPKGQIIREASQVRYIAFKSSTVNLVFDFNPYGVQQMFTDYPFSGEPSGVAGVARWGDMIEISIYGHPIQRSGALYAAKMLIYEGEFDYDEKHPYRKWGYDGGPTPKVHASFGTQDPGENIDAVDRRIYEKAGASGWADAEQTKKLTLVTTDDKNIYGNAVFSPAGASATFIQNVDPGLYVITIHAGHPKQTVGPFDVLVDGQRVARDIIVEAGQPAPVMISRLIRDSSVRISFTGKNWAIYSLAMQMFIQKNEDFMLDRKLWLVDGLYEPDFGVLKDLPPTVKVALPRFNTPPKTKFTHDGLEVALPAADNPALAWRRTMRMVSWAKGHAATGFEFNTPERVERQVLALKAEGFNTINEATFFWNLAYTNRWDEGVRMIRMINHFAHKHGMKVIHHCDATVINYMAEGMQYLMKHPDWMQRDIRYGLPTFSMICLNNPQLRKEVMGRFVRLARETGTDGFMLDEVTFASRDYCGCSHCRRKFTEQTGAVLPTDPTSSVFDNYDDPLWVKWVKWRQRCVGDWRVAFRKEFNKVNPSICFMVYTTHYGLTSRYAPREMGSNLVHAARACDFVGTEIMSRNVYESYRAVYAFRKIKTAIGSSYGGSIWGLVYHLDNPVAAYTGWAMNQMNLQTTWMASIRDENMARYLEWPHKVDVVNAKPVADIAILFSDTSRDFAKDYSSIIGGLGMSQMMTDAHVQHDIILDSDLRTDRLLPYKLVILPSVACMSKQSVTELREYVQQGGRLLVSGNTSFQDENGVRQGNFRLAELLGIDVDTKRAHFKGNHIFQRRDSKARFDVPLYAFRVTPRKATSVKVLADVVQDDTILGPALVVNRFGKGVCTYLASPLGQVNNELEATAGSKWAFEKNDGVAEAFLQIIRDSVPGGFDIRAVSVPEKVILSVHRQTGTKGKLVLVHLLNMTGSGTLKPGDVITKVTPTIPFPEIPAEIVFDVRLGNIRAGVVVSPDYDGTRQVTISKRKDGYVRVTVHKDDLKTYSIVYLLLD